MPRETELSILSDRDIKRLIAEGNILIEPFDPSLIRPNAISLRLGASAHRIESNHPVHIEDAETYPSLVPVATNQDGRISLHRGEVLLVPTLERVGLAPSLAGFLDGTSDVARLGISVCLSGQVSAGFGWGNPGILTLELVSHALEVVRLRVGMRICNLAFATLSSPAAKPYAQHEANYSGEVHPSGSRLYESVWPQAAQSGEED